MQGTSFKEDETHTLCHSPWRVAIPQGEVESSNPRFAGLSKFGHRISICLKAHLPGQFPHRKQSKRRQLAEPRIATKIDLYTALPTGGRSRSEWKQSADSNVAASIGEGSEGCHAFPNHSRLTQEMQPMTRWTSKGQQMTISQLAIKSKWEGTREGQLLLGCMNMHAAWTIIHMHVKELSNWDVLGLLTSWEYRRWSCTRYGGRPVPCMNLWVASSNGPAAMHACDWFNCCFWWFQAGLPFPGQQWTFAVPSAGVEERALAYRTSGCSGALGLWHHSRIFAGKSIQIGSPCKLDKAEVYVDAVASKQVLYRLIYAVDLASQRNSACIVVARTSPLFVALMPHIFQETPTPWSRCVLSILFRCQPSSSKSCFTSTVLSGSLTIPWRDIMWFHHLFLSRSGVDPYHILF